MSMESQNETGTEFVATDASVLQIDGEPVSVSVELPANEIGDGETGANDVVSDAVEIARIEADKEITIAAIQADTTVSLVESEIELQSAKIEAESEREETWQNQLAELRTNIAALDQKITDLSTVLAPPSIPTPQPEPDLVIVPETEAETLTPVSMSVPMLETQTEAILNDVVESPAETVALVKRIKRRLI